MTTPTTSATSPTPPPAPMGTPRWVWMLLTAALVAVGAGVLAHAGGTSVPDAIFKGGATLAGTVGLLLGIAHYVSRGR